MFKHRNPLLALVVLFCGSCGNIPEQKVSKPIPELVKQFNPYWDSCGDDPVMVDVKDNSKTWICTSKNGKKKFAVTIRPLFKAAFGEW